MKHDFLCVKKCFPRTFMPFADLKNEKVLNDY